MWLANNPIWVHACVLLPRRGYTPSECCVLPMCVAAGVFIALKLEQQDGSDILAGGFDGCYTYFASDQVSWASKPENWAAISRYSQCMTVPSMQSAVLGWVGRETGISNCTAFYFVLVHEAMLRCDVLSCAYSQSSNIYWHVSV